MATAAEKRITNSARGMDCAVRIPGICNFNNETTVFAHINGVRFGHGVGIKTKFGAYACSSCHDAIDGRLKTSISNQELKLLHYEGVFETMTILIQK